MAKLKLSDTKGNKPDRERETGELRLRVNVIDDLEVKVIAITREREKLIATLQEKEWEIEKHKSHSEHVKKAAPVIDKDKTDKLKENAELAEKLRTTKVEITRWNQVIAVQLKSDESSQFNELRLLIDENSKLTADTLEINREAESYKSRVSTTDQLNHEIQYLTIRLQSANCQKEQAYTYQIAELTHRLQWSTEEVSRLTSQLGELATLPWQFNEINSKYSSAGGNYEIKTYYWRQR